MENLENYGVVHMNQSELQEVEGGKLLAILAAIGMAILMGLIAHENLT